MDSVRVRTVTQEQSRVSAQRAGKRQLVSAAISSVYGGSNGHQSCGLQNAMQAFWDLRMPLCGSAAYCTENDRSDHRFFLAADTCSDMSSSGGGSSSDIPLPGAGNCKQAPSGVCPCWRFRNFTIGSNFQIQSTPGPDHPRRKEYPRGMTPALRRRRRRAL